MSLASSILDDLGEGLTLPITRRGLFSKDDFFQRFQNDYSTAVDDVLDRWGSRASKADRFASYRRLRERDASDGRDSQAATISENEDSYVIVVDMSEYAGGQITVQTVQCSAVVEGQCGGKSYKRKFPLPTNTVTDRVTADLSHENIMTVTAPKKGRAVTINTGSSDGASLPSAVSFESQIIPGDTQASVSSTSSSVGGETAVSSATQAIKSEALSSTQRRSSQSRIIPLNIEGETTQNHPTSTATSSSSEATSEANKEVSERIIPMVVGEQQAFRTSSFQNRVLPIKRRGKFFQDPAFENVWKDFETAIDEVVERRGSHAGMEGGDKDPLQSYRNLRDVVQQDDNQANKVSKESNEFKIVVDVKDYVDGHLDVKAVPGVIIVIGKKGPYSFERRFSVDGLTQPDKVSAALSTDGVLTITAPL